MMKRLLIFVGSLLLMTLAAFCLFGFMATFEPTSRPAMFMGFRVGYAVVGVACVWGLVALIVKAFQESGGNH